MAPVTLKERMLAHRDLHEEITRRSTCGPCLTLTTQANAIAGIHTRRHFD
jgi:hypothetical protein